MSRLPRLAIRNVARNRRRSRVTLAAILVGVAAAVLLRGMNGGFVDFMIRDVVETRTGALQIHRAGYLDSNEGMPLTLSMPADPIFVERIRAVPGVAAVAGRIQFGGLVTNGLTQTMFVGRAIDPTAEKQVCPRSGTDVVTGTPIAPGDRGVALLGDELARSFNAAPRGTPPVDPSAQAFHEVTLSSTSPEGRANSLSVRVKGLTRSAMLFENKRVVTVPLSVAQELLGMKDRVTEYAVAVRDMSQLEAVAERLRRAIGPDYEVHTWREIQPFYSDVIRVQRFLIGLISFVLYAIVLTGIANTMLMSVYERVREIGTMLAVGIRRRQILALFLIEATVLGVLGAALGALAGYFLALNLAFVSPESFEPLFTFIGYAVLILGGLASYAGVALGAIVLWTLLEATRFLDLPLAAEKVAALRFMLVGLLLILLMAFRPQGILGNRREMVLGD
jgi:putative ABC transport system permease protein